MDQGPGPAEDANVIPRRTTPTWDMELLLSGATVFALFQGVQATIAGGRYLIPRLEGDLLTLTNMLLIYGCGGLILLALTFALHLVIRAYWIALIGMNSVFPGGIRFDRLNAGPIAKSLLVEGARSMEENIERADNAATIVFGIGVSIVLVLVPVSLVVTAMFAFLGVMGSITGLEKHLPWMMLALMALMFVPYLLAVTADTRLGHRLAPGSRGYRLTRAALAFYAKVGMSRASNPLVSVFGSNIGERRGQAIVFVVMLVGMLSSIGVLNHSQRDLGLGSFWAFPDPRPGMEASVEGRGYASNHEPGWSPTAPYLPTMVVRGDYLRLVVPYVPKGHGSLMRACMPGRASKQSADERKRRAALLSCFSRNLQITLDGEDVALRPEWYTEPARDLRGLLYMVPVRALAQGRHEVSVLSKPAREPKAGDDPVQAQVIPFWR